VSLCPPAGVARIMSALREEGFLVLHAPLSPEGARVEVVR